MEKTIAELFAGVGGFRRGFEKASEDWKTVWFSQWEPGQKGQWAYNCYIHHWPESANENCNKDISEVDKSSIPDHTVLVGGFPCQDYSVARPLSGSNGLEGKKGVLWWQIRDIIEAKQPAFVLLENVDRLLKSPASQRGRDFGVMLSCLTALGYDAEWRVINAADYGGAQRRRRVFIFAWNRDSHYGKSIMASVEDRFAKTGYFATVFPIESMSAISETSLNGMDVYEVSERFKFEFGNAGYLHGGIASTTFVNPKSEGFIPLSDTVQQDVDERYYLNGNKDKWEYLKGSKKIPRKHKDGHEYLYREGAIAFPDPMNLPGRTMLTSESTVNRSSHVIEDPQTGKLRIITPVEAERLQGFDDDWTNTGMPERARYFCMGNALVVPMAERMAEFLEKIIDAE